MNYDIDKMAAYGRLMAKITSFTTRKSDAEYRFEVTDGHVLPNVDDYHSQFNVVYDVFDKENRKQIHPLRVSFSFSKGEDAKPVRCSCIEVSDSTRRDCDVSVVIPFVAKRGSHHCAAELPNTIFYMVIDDLNELQYQSGWKLVDYAYGSDIPKGGVYCSE